MILDFSVVTMVNGDYNRPAAPLLLITRHMAATSMTKLFSKPCSFLCSMQIYLKPGEIRGGYGTFANIYDVNFLLILLDVLS